jgi:hypothetical protein
MCARHLGGRLRSRRCPVQGAHQQTLGVVLSSDAVPGSLTRSCARSCHTHRSTQRRSMLPMNSIAVARADYWISRLPPKEEIVGSSQSRRLQPERIHAWALFPCDQPNVEPCGGSAGKPNNGQRCRLALASALASKPMMVCFSISCTEDSLPEWSKGVDSSSTSARCVGSNPTAVKSMHTSALFVPRRVPAYHCAVPPINSKTRRVEWGR